MEGLQQYLLSVTGAAMICGVVLRLLPQKGTAATMGKMLAGIFLAFTVIRPLGAFQIGKLEDFTADLQAEAADAVAAGQADTVSSLQSIIKDQCEAYILDKAHDLGLQLTVEITLSSDDLPVPVAVRLQGNAGPYARSRLETILQDDLGISKEHQVWI